MAITSNLMSRVFGKIQQAALVASFVGSSFAADACQAIDFQTVPLPSGDDPIAVLALLAAYPELSFDAQQSMIIMPNGNSLALGDVRGVGASDRLQSATIAEQFLYPYPLDFDLEARRTPWVDPGRLRNDAFFRQLYFQDKASARKTLSKVVYLHGAKASFYMTGRNGVDCQLAAVFADLMPHQKQVAKFFNKVGGSFNWRKISGTNRLSAHSFGMALDLNTALGQYWKWSGAKVGAAHDYNNKYPEELVAIFEKYGFIWGGKWHHFDGMHFEYRPELILYARLLEQ